MKKNNILALLVAMTTFYACSTVNLPSTPDIYYDEFYKSTVEPDCRLLNSGIIYTLCKHKNGKFILSKFYPETKTLVSRQEFSNRELTTPAGKYVEKYWKTGATTLEGSFDVFFQREGMWKEYSYQTGKLIAEMTYIHGKLNGDYIRYFDSTDLQIQSRIPFNNGLRHGEGFVFDLAGKPIKHYEYLSGNIINVELAAKEDSTVIAKFPSPLCEKIVADKERQKCEEEEIFRLITKYFNFREVFNAGISNFDFNYGFDIDKDGNLTNPIIYRGINEKYNTKFMKMIDMMPKWKSATSNGVPITSHYRGNINAKLRRENPYGY
jgi:hypothetical protein